MHRSELEAIVASVEKRPGLTMFDDFGGRIPSDKPPIKTPGELAIERGEPWPKPAPEPAFKAAIAQATRAAEAAQAEHDRTTNGANGYRGAPGAPNQAGGVSGRRPTQPDYGAPAGWHAPGWPPQQPPGHWYPPQSVPPQYWPQPPQSYPRQPYPPYPPYPPPGQPAPDADKSPDRKDEDARRPNPPAHG